MLLLLHAVVQMLAGALVAHATYVRLPSRANDNFIWRLCAALYVDLLTAAPLIAYQARLWPAYAFGYAIDPLLSPWVESWAPLISLAALAAMPLCFALGFCVCTVAQVRGRRWIGAAPLFVLTLAALALFGWHYDEFTVIGDFPTYWRGGGSVAHKHFHVQLLLFAYAAGAMALWPLRRRLARA